MRLFPKVVAFTSEFTAPLLSSPGHISLHCLPGYLYICFFPIFVSLHSDQYWWLRFNLCYSVSSICSYLYVVFPPPTFVVADSSRQCSSQPKELEKIRFETGKSLFSSDRGCLLQFLPPTPLLTGLSFSMNGGEWLDRTNVDCALTKIVIKLFLIHLCLYFMNGSVSD